MERELLSFILDALKSVKDTSIGEGNFGIVIDRFPSKALNEVCAKYHKFGYNPNEYQVLTQAFMSGLPVPAPMGEWPEHRVFAMKRVIGKTLEELDEQGLVFSEDMAEEIMDAVHSVCKVIRHNDLFPRNVMIEDVEIVDGVVVDAVVYVIDFGQSVMKLPDNNVSETVPLLSWLNRRVARKAVV